MRVEREDVVRDGQRPRAVADQEEGRPLPGALLQRFEDALLGGLIQMRRGLVEQQQPLVAREDPGERQPLPLPCLL
nr:hypothetical protein [Corallococcus exiguus]